MGAAALFLIHQSISLSMVTFVSFPSRLPRAALLLVVSALVCLLLAACSSSGSSNSPKTRRMECEAAGNSPYACKEWIPN